MFRRTAIPAVLAALALTASATCSGGAADKGSAGANPTLATEPPRTTTTNPYAVPAVIDAAYVDRVLAGLDAVIGDALRLVVRSGTIPPEVIDRLKAVSGNRDVLQLFIDGIQLDMNTGFKNYRQQLGNRLSTTTKVLVARSDCIFVQVHRDYSAISTDSSAVVNPQWAALKRLGSASPGNEYNPTPWTFVYDGFTHNRSQPADPCAS